MTRIPCTMETWLLRCCLNLCFQSGQYESLKSAAYVCVLFFSWLIGLKHLQGWIRKVSSAAAQLHHAWLCSGRRYSIFSEGTCCMFPFLSCPDDLDFWIPTGRAAWLNEAHSSLPLHCMARSWYTRDHPVPDSVCQNCKRLYQQDPRHRTKYCTLQVCAAAKGQWHRALVPTLGKIPDVHPC